MDTAQLEAEALALPADERLQLAQRLWQSCKSSKDVVEAIEDSIAVQRDTQMQRSPEMSVSSKEAFAKALERAC